jgi:hypothetical protein
MYNPYRLKVNVFMNKTQLVAGEQLVADILGETYYVHVRDSPKRLT